MISGYDYRTFPRKEAWKDENGFYYIRDGISSFHFRGHYGKLPSKYIQLRKTIQGVRVTLTCERISAIINTREVVEDAPSTVTEEPHYSTVCGKAILVARGIDVSSAYGKRPKDRITVTSPERVRKHQCLEDDV